MKRKNKLILYVLLLIFRLLVFVPGIIFQKPDGIVGLIVCIFSVCLIIGSIVRLCMLSENFANVLPSLLDLLHWFFSVL